MREGHVAVSYIAFLEIRAGTCKEQCLLRKLVCYSCKCDKVVCDEVVCEIVKKSVSLILREISGNLDSSRTARGSWNRRRGNSNLESLFLDVAV